MIAPLVLLANATLGPGPNLAKRLQSIVTDPAHKGGIVSVCALRADGTVLFEQQSETRVVPASNAKIISTLYALHRLGPDYRPETKLWQDEKSLWVYSPGDPSMTVARLEEAATGLQAPSFENVFVEQAYRPNYAPGWEWDDLPNAYAAKITAFTVNKGIFELYASEELPEELPIAFGVNVHVDSDAESKYRAVYNPTTGDLQIAGKLPKDRKMMERFALPDPSAAAASLLGGPFSLGEAPKFAPPTMTILGAPLIETVKDCLVPSDNHHAEHLLLMGAGSEGKLDPVNPYPEATKRVKNFLSRIGLNPDYFNPSDGSGLSRHNLVTTKGIAQLLRWSQKQPWGAAYEAALAAPGIGTLKSRLVKSTFKGKTGTLDLVCALSGFVTAKNGEKVVVSMILNHSLAPSSVQRDLQDRFVREIEAAADFGTDPAN